MKKYNILLRTVSQIINVAALIFLVVSLFTIVIRSGGTQKAAEHLNAMITVILTSFYCFLTATGGIIKSRKIKKSGFNVFLGLFGAAASLVFALSMYFGKPLFAPLGEIWSGEYFYSAFCILLLLYAFGAAINKNKLGREDED